MTMTEIEKVAGPLRELLREREFIARCELLLRTYDIVRSAKLSDQERMVLRKTVGERIAPSIFTSILGKEPILFDLPAFDSYTQIDGRIYHFSHTKKFGKKEIDKATDMLLRSLPELKTILQQCMVDRLTDFMNEAGYTLFAQSGQELTFSAAKRMAKAFVVTSVKSLDLNNYNPEPGVDYIVMVPSSETLGPFVQFFQENGSAAEDKGLNIWIMNLEKGSIDPFVGYTTDLDIYNQFDNPRLAEMVRSNWSCGCSQ